MQKPWQQIAKPFLKLLYLNPDFGTSESGFFMLRIIHLVQNLSLDITAGAVISAMFLSEVMDVAMNMHMVVGLAVAIWLIYTFDHLSDAYRTKGKATNPRHAFHQKYFRHLIVLAVLVFGVGVYNLFFLPERTVVLGAILVGLSGLYFLYITFVRKHSSKELFAAFVYTAGISTAPVSQVASFELLYLLIILCFLLLAYANLLLIPMFEVAVDREDGQYSIVTRLGSRSVKRLLIGLIMLGLLLNQWAFGLSGWLMVYLIVLLMHITIIGILIKPNWFRKYQLYRILSDGIFFLPALIFL